MLHSPPLRSTPLAALHEATGGRMVTFAGWRLPMQFPAGIIAEALQCRAAAGLFDVSHMGQIELHGADADAALERLVPADILHLAEGRQVYTQLLNPAGGIIDDLMVGRLGGHLRLVVNAARTAADLDHLAASLPADVRVVPRPDLALLALQGPSAALVLARHARGVARMGFMAVADMVIGAISTVVARCGYTGEDGFEIALPAAHAAAFAAALLAEPEVAPAGLGARDTLRLEAGLCLYGQELDEASTPVEAGLGWSIGRRQRRDGGFAGDAAVLPQLTDGAARRLVGLRPAGRSPVRAGATIQIGDECVGVVTSGGYSPTLRAPIAMGYVRAEAARPGTELSVGLRDRCVAAEVSALPFVPKHFVSPIGVSG